MGAAAAGAAVVGGAVNAYSQIQAGRAAVKAANRQQSYLNQQAMDTVGQGEFASDVTIERGDQTVGSQRTGFAANGVVVGEGSAARVEQSTMNIARQDAQQLRLNAFNQAMGLANQGNELLRQSKADMKTAKLNALGSLLTSGSQAAGMSRRS